MPFSSRYPGVLSPHHGFSLHTLSFWNQNGRRFWVKRHFKTNQGINCLANEEAAKIPAHGAQKDLVEAIERGDYPSCTVELQIMPEVQALTYRIIPSDLTIVPPCKAYALIKMGKLKLNKKCQQLFRPDRAIRF